MTGSDDLQLAVESLKYLPGWRFNLYEMPGMYQRILEINLDTIDSGDMKTPIKIRHAFSAPPAFGNYPDPDGWIFSCIMKVHRHEAGEMFEIEGKKPFYPQHGLGSDPYGMTR